MEPPCVKTPRAEQKQGRENNEKRRKTHCQDAKVKALLALSNYCQEQWVDKVIRLHMTRGTKRKMVLLSGDAGCGKSYAIAMLERKLKILNVSVTMSAMTNKAAGALAETCGTGNVYTFHKMMGYKRHLLDDGLRTDRFKQSYAQTYFSSIATVGNLRLKACDNAHSTVHGCTRFRPEACGVCSDAMTRMRTNNYQGLSLDSTPLFVGSNVLIIDEYGLMTVDAFEKMQCCLDLYYDSPNGPLIVFAGSVSQLQPPGNKRRIWETDTFETSLALSSSLFVNRRMFVDPAYSEAVTYLQFNTITEEAQRIFRGQAKVSFEKITSPDYEPEKVRIFHQDSQVADFTRSYLTSIERKKILTGDKYIGMDRLPNSGSGSSVPWYEVMKQATQAFPKLFSVPNPCKNATAQQYLKANSLWIGCRVKLVWHMDTNGIQILKDKRSFFANALHQDQRSKVSDSEGTVTAIKYNAKKGYNEFTVRGDSGILYNVGLSAWHHKNWIVNSHPLACLLAMNTYDCQGATVKGGALYHPPANFNLSPLKPSVYVVLSRVVTRDNLELTNCNFADTVGTVQLYPSQLLEYRKRVEMNYS